MPRHKTKPTPKKRTFKIGTRKDLETRGYTNKIRTTTDLNLQEYLVLVERCYALQMSFSDLLELMIKQFFKHDIPEIESRIKSLKMLGYTDQDILRNLSGKEKMPPKKTQ